MKLEVEMFSGGGGIVSGVGTLYGLFVGDSCSSSRLVGAAW